MTRFWILDLSLYTIALSRIIFNCKMWTVVSVCVCCVKSIQSCLTHAAVPGVTKSWTRLSDWTNWLNSVIMVAACQTPLSMGSYRQKYWWAAMTSPPGNLLNHGKEGMSLACPALVGWFLTISATWEAEQLNFLQMMLAQIEREIRSSSYLIHNICFILSPALLLDRVN